MQDNISRFLTQVPDNLLRRALDPLFRALGRSVATVAVRGAGLEIAAALSPLAQIGASSTFVATVDGRLLTVAAGVDMPALSGSVANAAFNVFCFFTTAAGTRSTVMGTAGSALNQVRFPDFAPSSALIGFVIVNPTGTGPFVGGTTALDDATVVPNAVYVSPVGAFDPTFLYN